MRQDTRSLQIESLTELYKLQTQLEGFFPPHILVDLVSISVWKPITDILCLDVLPILLLS